MTKRTLYLELEIGEVGESKFNRVHDILKNIPIDKSESSGWNCQDWATRWREGFVYDYLAKEAVKNWLKEV
ncbi:hypothetical protein ACRE_075540 [Hapsidospora chrysogenum ATCC 11550]|uniref:Uncharacterized protein n=1 Tax=Hapsidospora chrysogenum (strain ATCC 11550 / CBS 779.69 / DSM 880 / IAM 14645 / JCM 23072 / IMI 49137) TaxID=857340 RepID=A0A086SX92_HAPC1|nr:hypothetical protein ACRE_075540 [Hapsidospora chrysogenum ATCC 11550]